MLSMLAEAEPRGLPGATTKTVKFQQRVQGSPLDDVYVEAEYADGSPAYLEIQAKRSLTFTASDTEFADVVAQLWEAASKPDFPTEQRELAVAVAKTTTRIEQDCQEVLHWAREIGSADTFISNIELKGFGSEGMRSLVAVVRQNLKNIGAPSDNETVWRILRRFQILVFDLGNPGSDFDHRARERARSVLSARQAERAGDLWSRLATIAGTNATAAGDRLDRVTLVDQLQREDGYEIGLPTSLQAVGEKLSEDAHLTLDSIDDEVGGQRLSRAAVVDRALGLLADHKLVHVIGAPGTGKSSVLKHLAIRADTEGRVVVLRNGRIAGGGWRAMANAYGCHVSLEHLLNELGCGSGATLFIDNIDQIEGEADRATICDLLGGIKNAPGWRVVTTGSSSSREWSVELPFDPSEIGTVELEDLSDDEAAVLAVGNGAIGLLLVRGHPAEKLARNLFYLARLVQLAPQNPSTIATELDLARLWWSYAGGRGEDNDFLARRIVLRAMAKAIIANPREVGVDVDHLDPAMVTELLKLGVLRYEIPGTTVAFRHDVLRDWTVGFVVDENRLFTGLNKQALLPVSLVRGLELAATIALSEDDGGNLWRNLVADAQNDGDHPSWVRPILLALPRAAKSYEHLVANQSLLLADEAKLLQRLMRLMLSADTEPASRVVARVRPDTPVTKSFSDIVLPKGLEWVAVLAWLHSIADDLPGAIVPELVRMLRGWFMLTQGAIPSLNGQLVELVFTWLLKIDQYMEPRSFSKGEKLPDPLNVPNVGDTRDLLQQTAFAFASLNPDAAATYLREVTKLNLRYTELQPLVKLRGNLAKAAPSAYVDMLLKALADDDDQDRYSSRRSMGPFTLYDEWFSPASPAQGPFLDILLTEAAEGLRLINGLLDKVMTWSADGDPSRLQRMVFEIEGEDYDFLGGASSYRWARTGLPSKIITSALLVLEAWGHMEIERGEPFGRVLRDVLGPKGSSIARLTGAVDLVLSHWALARDIAWPLVACSRLMAYDNERSIRDSSGIDNLSKWGVEPAGPVKLADLEVRHSRKAALNRCVGYYVFNAPEELRTKFVDAVHKDVANVKKPAETGDQDPIKGHYAVAQRLLRMVDRENWAAAQAQTEDGCVFDALQFVPSDDEQVLISSQMEELLQSHDLMALRISIQNAMLGSSSSTPELVRKAIDWARNINDIDLELSENRASDEAFEIGCNRRAVVMAAAVALRDYEGEYRSDVVSWAETVLLEAAFEKDSEFRASPQIEYNRNAIAALGLQERYYQDPSPARAEQLLTLAANWHPAVAAAFEREFSRMAVEAPQLLRSIIRIVMTSSVYVQKADGNGIIEGPDTAKAIAGELAWLRGETPEPGWPFIPPWYTTERRGIRIGLSFDVDDDEDDDDEPSDTSINEERVGSMLQGLVPLTTNGVPDWMGALTAHFYNWALDANGRGSARARDRRPTSFNHRFFDFVGVVSVALPCVDVVRDFIEPLGSLPDESFHDAVGQFLEGFDRATLAINTVKSDDPAAIRQVIIRRVVTTRNYERTKRDIGLSTESHAAGAYKALFFLTQNWFVSTKPIIPANWPGLPDVAPALTSLITGAPGSGYLASIFMTLLETSPSRLLVPSFTRALAAWCTSHDTSHSFWLGNGLGSRVVDWLESALNEQDGPRVSQSDIDSLLTSLAVLVRVGVTSAPDLEVRLTAMVGRRRA
jgi:hypothetical protein